jgi:multiple sugar transport system permease protein
MSAIGGIDKSIFEAADIDGANSAQVFVHITLPSLRPMVIYTLITSMIGGLQMWDIPYLYKNGQAWNRATETIAVFIYNHFHIIPQNYGYSAAASVILFVITSALGCICFAMNTDKEDKKKKALAKEQKKLAKLQSKSSFGGF